MQITYADLERWDVCDRDTRYTRAAFLALTGGRESITPAEVFDLAIPPQDKLWLLLRPEIIPERELHLLACEFAEHVLPADCDPRSRAALEVKRRWVDGRATDEELGAAGAAAGAAARAAAGSAAWAAARAAALDAIVAATAWASAGDSEWQIERICEVLKGGGP